MDSIIAKANDGFDKDGNFLNGQTQLLPWPVDIKFGFLSDVITDSSDCIPNPYDASGGYFTISSAAFTYFNSDGTIKWVASSADSGGSFPTNFAVIKVESDGIYCYCASSYSIVKINLDSRVATRSSLRDDLSMLALTESNVLYATFEGTSSEGDKYSYIINENLTTSTNSNELGVVDVKLNNDSYIVSGVPLFNGSLVLISGGIYSIPYGYTTSNYIIDDRASVLWGINNDLDMTMSKANKKPLRTDHALAVNMFEGRVRQISKDLFVSILEQPVGSYGKWTAFNKSNKYYTRKELERWASNCIYATTGFRISLDGDA